jgi:hypothetical protein
MSHEQACFLCKIKKDTREYKFDNFQGKPLCHLCFKDNKPIECDLCGAEYILSISHKMGCSAACSAACHTTLQQHPYIRQLSNKFAKKTLNDSALKDKITDLEETVEKLNEEIDVLEKTSRHHKFLTDNKIAGLLEKLNENKISFDDKINDLKKTIAENKPKPELSLINLMKKSANISNKKIKKFEKRYDILYTEIVDENKLIKFHDDNFNIHEKNIEKLEYLISTEDATLKEDLVYHCKSVLTIETKIIQYETETELINKIKVSVIEKNRQLNNIRKKISTHKKEFKNISIILE